MTYNAELSRDRFKQYRWRQSVGLNGGLYIMKPKEKKPAEVFRIIDRKTGEAVGSYSRAYCDEFDFSSADEARNANCHNVFYDKGKYKIAKYRVTYELIDDDV